MIKFHSGPPKGFKQDFESFLFNTRKHRNLQAKVRWKEFHIINYSDHKILSSIYFHLKDNIARSPLKAPFGSFEVSSAVEAKIFSAFVLYIEAELSIEKIQSIEIVCPPELYNTQQPLITTTLLNQGFAVQSEPGCCIVVDDRPLASKMQKNKQRQLKKSEQENLIYKAIPLTQLKHVYNFIDSQYKKRNRKLSMTLSQLSATIKVLPQSFFLVGVYQNKKLTTASICIKVTNSIVYTFYSVHSDFYDNLSPRIFMISKLYDWCFNNGIKLLDLGTSSLGGLVNLGLLDFKRRVGGTLTPKYTFKKQLA